MYMHYMFQISQISWEKWLCVYARGYKEQKCYVSNNKNTFLEKSKFQLCLMEIKLSKPKYSSSIIVVCVYVFFVDSIL